MRRLSILSLSSLSPGGVHNTPEEADEVVYHVGFQVDMPNAILRRSWDGSYIVNHGAGVPSLPAPPPHERRAIISKDLQALLSDPAFVNSLSISTSTIAPTFENTHDKSQLLNLILLEYSPDFIHVLSLKGFFLFVAPSIRNVLGLEADELVGESIAEYCRPADLVPLMRELKESSVPDTVTGSRRTVDLLFRVRSKSEGYVWVESRGWLHVEPGKGRKVIILNGGVRSMPMMR